MAASEELYGEGHPATYNLDDADNPLYDRNSEWYDLELHERFQKGMILGAKVADELVYMEFSEEFYGEDPADHGIWVPRSHLFPKSIPDDRRDS